MSKQAWSTLAAVIALSAGCTTATVSAPPKDIAQVRLAAAPQNAGKVALATLVTQANATEIVLLISGVPPYVAQPAHLYTYIYPGACGSLGPKPAFELNRQVVLGEYVPTSPMRMTK